MWRVIRYIIYSVLGIFLGGMIFEAASIPRTGELQTNNPASTSLIEARNREFRSRGVAPKRFQIWVPLDRISPSLQRAVIAGEDNNFATHHGFDYQAIQRAWDQAQKEAEKEAQREGENDSWLPNLPDFKRGASTISQQLAKNLYLSSERSFMRKGQEAIITYFMERNLSKKRILELYLNVIEWGSGVFGAEAAAQKYFGIHASQLSVDQAARLAAMAPNPRFYERNQNAPGLQRKIGIIRDRMAGAELP